MLIFALGRTAILFTIFFHAIRNLTFLLISVIEDYSQKLKRKKQEQTIINKPIKKL